MVEETSIGGGTGSGKSGGRVIGFLALYPRSTGDRLLVEVGA